MIPKPEEFIDFDSYIDAFSKRGTLSSRLIEVVQGFFSDYKKVVQSMGKNPQQYLPILAQFMQFIELQIVEPYQFEPYHVGIKNPGYYKFGLEFIRPLIHFQSSTFTGQENLQQVLTYLEKNENVIFFANHQIEAEPQTISLMLEERAPKLGEQLIYAAGERVITDPVAVPLSKGHNLLCIYSKKYFDAHPEDRAIKQQHNRRAMEKLSEVLSEGGKAVYVAPSGGRDRTTEEGIIKISPFDPQSIEMFRLFAKKSGKPTHFFPMALATHSIMPPPATLRVELGEKRATYGGSAHIHIAQEIDLDTITAQNLDKRELRKKRADDLWNIVNTAYQKFPKEVRHPPSPLSHKHMR